MTAHWWLDTHDKAGLLWAFMQHFVGRATLSFEGELRELGLETIPGITFQETGVLRRQTIAPVQDFCTIPVTNEVIRILKRTLSRPGIFNDAGALVHAQIEHEGALVFGAYDNFHRDCVVAYPPTPEEFLKELCARGVLRGLRGTSQS